VLLLSAMELAEGGHAAAGEDSFNDFHDETGSNHVRVVLRLRPPVSGLRIADGGEHHAMGTAGDVNLAERSLKLPGMPHCIFDEVYSAEMAPDEVYMGTLASLVDGLLAGENGTLFTWGAPGSGKTREVFGESSIEATAVRGLAHIMVDQLFSEINRLHSEQMAGRPALRSSVYVSALELGGLEVVDLLAQPRFWSNPENASQCSSVGRCHVPEGRVASSALQHPSPRTAAPRRAPACAARRAAAAALRLLRGPGSGG